MSLRKRIADSERYNDALASVLERYVRFCHRTTRWQRLGFEPLDALVGAGTPAIAALWHQRLMLAPYLFPVELGPICSITSSGRAGTLAGRMQTRFGFQTIAMSSHKRHVALSRDVLGRIKSGVSVGIATDGPRGPARQASTVPLVWARAAGVRIFGVAFSTRKAKRLGTWDRMFLPMPFDTGALVCREWPQTVPRKASPEQIEALRLDLQAHLNAVTEEADRAANRPLDKV